MHADSFSQTALLSQPWGHPAPWQPTSLGPPGGIWQKASDPKMCSRRHIEGATDTSLSFLFLCRQWRIEVRKAGGGDQTQNRNNEKKLQVGIKWLQQSQSLQVNLEVLTLVEQAQNTCLKDHVSPEFQSKTRYVIMWLNSQWQQITKQGATS